ncbi:toll/interleukin-1 receptor domain-containing protein [bacterium]|nr:toll/interleukin-1 receptor domain-containing protein [bacterium]
MPTIFICYSHRDSAAKDALLEHLKRLRDVGSFEIWCDTDRIRVGDRFTDEILAAIQSSDVAVVLVSMHSVNSEYIRDIELHLIQRRHEEEGLYVYPVIVGGEQAVRVVEQHPYLRSLHAVRLDQLGPKGTVDDMIDSMRRFDKPLEAEVARLLDIFYSYYEADEIGSADMNLITRQALGQRYQCVPRKITLAKAFARQTPLKILRRLRSNQDLYELSQQILSTFEDARLQQILCSAHSGNQERRLVMEYPEDRKYIFIPPGTMVIDGCRLENALPYYISIDPVSTGDLSVNDVHGCLTELQKERRHLHLPTFQQLEFASWCVRATADQNPFRLNRESSSAGEFCRGRDDAGHDRVVVWPSNRSSPNRAMLWSNISFRVCFQPPWDNIGPYHQNRLTRGAT